jgi:prolipoprotein diacylglyceryltransferase
MHPIFFKIPLPFRIFEHEELVVRAFGVMTMLGVIAGFLWLARALRRIGVTERDAVGDLVTICVLTGFIGARWLYLVVHPAAQVRSRPTRCSRSVPAWSAPGACRGATPITPPRHWPRESKVS